MFKSDATQTEGMSAESSAAFLVATAGSHTSTKTARLLYLLAPLGPHADGLRATAKEEEEEERGSIGSRCTTA